MKDLDLKFEKLTIITLAGIGIVMIGFLVKDIRVYADTIKPTPITQSKVEDRVLKLEELIHILEQRIAALEAQTQRSNPQKIQLNKNPWRRLQKGMSEEEVEGLLGSPTRIDEFGTFSVWEYNHSSVRGRIQFDAKSGLGSWNEPR